MCQSRAPARRSRSAQNAWHETPPLSDDIHTHRVSYHFFACMVTGRGAARMEPRAAGGLQRDRQWEELRNRIVSTKVWYPVPLALCGRLVKPLHCMRVPFSTQIAAKGTSSCLMRSSMDMEQVWCGGAAAMRLPCVAAAAAAAAALQLPLLVIWGWSPTNQSPTSASAGAMAHFSHHTPRCALNHKQAEL